MRERSELAADAAGSAYPKPTVGAVVVADGEIVGEGVTEAGGRHAEVVALDRAGSRARGATLYVTLEPCAHQGTTPPCSARIAGEGIARVVVGARDPNPIAAGGVEELRAGGVEVELLDSFAARTQNEAWRTWVSLQRPFVTYKVAASLDGRVAIPGRRFISGERSRRLVHELRAASDAVAVGMGTVRADSPRLDAREVDTPRGQPRRLAFGRGPLPPSSELELRSGPLRDELEALAAEGVQSLLLEGGPTLAAAFLEAGLIDKILVFVAPLLAPGEGPAILPAARIRVGRSPTSARAGWGRTSFSKPMSTRPEFQRPDDELVSLLSRWLEHELGNDELRRRIDQGCERRARTVPAGRRPGSAVVAALDNAFPGERDGLEQLVRETVESLAYGA